MEVFTNMKKCKLKGNYGYSILGEKPPEINKEAIYYIVDKSTYFPNCVIVSKADKPNEKLIVPYCMVCEL